MLHYLLGVISNPLNLLSGRVGDIVRNFGTSVMKFYKFVELKFVSFNFTLPVSKGRRRAIDTLTVRRPQLTHKKKEDKGNNSRRQQGREQLGPMKKTLALLLKPGSPHHRIQSQQDRSTEVLTEE